MRKFLQAIGAEVCVQVDDDVADDVSRMTLMPTRGFCGSSPLRKRHVVDAPALKTSSVHCRDLQRSRDDALRRRHVAPPPLEDRRRARRRLAPGALAQRRLANSRATLRLQRVAPAADAEGDDGHDDVQREEVAPRRGRSCPGPVVGVLDAGEAEPLGTAPAPASLNLSDIGQRMQPPAATGRSLDPTASVARRGARHDE